ncbi:integral membrane protein, Mpv17/PMP22 family [Fonsecaea pedrosoi]|nr:integral membrane protein, Mpv17/PMP22 family [Fonsecaea pedrosoi]
MSEATSSPESSRLLRVTLEGAIMSAVSNTLAQILRAYRGSGGPYIDPVALVHFIIIAVVTTPPNYKWQLALERNFPTNPARSDEVMDTREKKKEKNDGAPSKKEKESLSVTNTIAKFVLDQTIGASLNTIWFIIMINLLRGEGLSYIIATIQKDFFPMLIAGYKFWPVVTLLNLVVVPVEHRMFVGGLAGLAWGVYVSLMNI